MRVLTLALILAGLSLGREAGHAQDRPTGAPLAGAGVDADRPHVGRQMGRLFISPMGEPFRAPAGGRNPIDVWFDQADTNHDGALTDAEFDADAARFFAILDRGHDGEIDPDDIEVYEDRIVPEVRVGGGGGGGRAAGSHGRGGGGGRRGGGGGGFGGGGRRSGGDNRGSEGGDSAAPSQPAYDSVRQGAARYGFFDYPEPITVADTDFNRGISPKEFEAAADSRFAVLDKNGDGRVTRAELPRFDPPAAALAPPSRRPMVRPHRDEDRDTDG
ncbi:EF-hand domain-containing protein [Sphingomonas sp. TREG-RG-20F-R18-01]|uniref:EF-hand domain-containing protein n=1 Tax=Sphingomonas sp. TREG-RG-20F-R18-01 TaxID=2914982 RepID=UPI001F5A2CF1|nr:EF-hand domain-containing protein [Sphingomonas sp. TREG-RG-20F-R18-01]